MQTHTIRRDALSLVPAARISDIVLSTGTNPPTITINQMKSHKTSSDLERTEFFPNENFRLIILYLYTFMLNTEI